MTTQDCLAEAGTNAQSDASIPNINSVNVTNIFYNNSEAQKVTVSDFRRIVSNSLCKELDEKVVNQVAEFGYNKEHIMNSLQNGEVNHATATYYLLISDRVLS